MSIVVDASVLVAALVDSGPRGTWAEAQVAADSLHAPELIRVETASALRRLERAGGISSLEANAAFDDLMQLDLVLYPFDPFAARIWELRHSIASYDAWYVAIAEALNLPFATLDGRLARAKGASCRFLNPPAG